MRGGGLICARQPLLSHNGDIVFLSCAESVLAFCTHTGERLYSLQHATLVTALALHFKEGTSLLYVATQDGRLTLWDVETRMVLKTWNLDCLVESLVVCEDTAYISCHWGKHKAGRLIKYDLNAETTRSGRAKLASANSLVASSCGRVLATVDRHSAMIWQASCFPQQSLVLTHTKPLTCAALSRSGEILAVGDATGRILIWRGIRKALQCDSSGNMHSSHADPHPFLPLTTVHWHAGPVSCLAFSSEESFLLSGGQEAVLVMWDLSSGRRSYLPRLGGPLCFITACPAPSSPTVAVSVRNNLVRLVDLGALRVQCSVHGLSVSTCTAPGACIAAQPVMGFLAIADQSESVQLFDAFRNVGAGRLQLSTPSNFGKPTGQEFLEGKGAPPRWGIPIHMVFSADGQMLAVVEQCRAASGTQTKLTLGSLYEGEVERVMYLLAAGKSHYFSIQDTVTAIALHPKHPVAALALGGGATCILHFKAAPHAPTWAPSNHFKGSKATAVTFSPDGTVLAIASTTSSPVLLVDPVSQQTLTALPAVEAEVAIPLCVQHLVFLADGLHLAATWTGGIAVYCLLSNRVVWICKLPTACLAVDSHSARAACSVAADGFFMLNSSGLTGDGAKLLHGLHGTAAYFLKPPGYHELASSAFLVVNDSYQYAINPSSQCCDAPEFQPFWSRKVEAEAQPQRIPKLPSSTCQASITWMSQHGIASHLLIAASNLCHPALEELLR